MGRHKFCRISRKILTLDTTNTPHIIYIMPERGSEKKKKNPLEEALENFMDALPDMLTVYEGRWVAFGPTDKEPVAGYWHCEEDAFQIAYQKFGPFGTSYVVFEVSRENLPKEGETLSMVKERLMSLQTLVMPQVSLTI